MALSPQLLNFKSSGVYRLEFDKSQTANINVETLRLVVGHSRKGPYNTPVLIDSQETFNNVFGSIDKGLEKKGMFFHRSCIEALSRGPILALNLAKFTEGDVASFQAPSTNGSQTGTNLSVNGTGVYDKFFDNDKFMTPSDAATLAEINAGDNNLLNFVNIKQDSITVIVRQAASVREFDLTAREWYGEGNVPEYLNDFDKISDFMIDVFVFRGEFDAVTMSNDPIYSKYFTADGLDKALLNEFANLRQVSLIAQYTGSILPGFKDLEGRNLYIESIINTEARRTGLFCAVDEDQVINENGTKVDFVGHIVDEDQDYELLSHVVKQSAVLSNHPIDIVPANVVTVTGDTLTITDITQVEANKAFIGEDSLLAATNGEYALIETANWVQTAAAIPAVPLSYNKPNENSFYEFLSGDTTDLLPGNTVIHIKNSDPAVFNNYMTEPVPLTGSFLFAGTGVANTAFTVSFDPAIGTILTAVNGTFASLNDSVDGLNLFASNGVTPAQPAVPAKGTLTLVCDVDIKESTYEALSGTSTDLNFYHVSNTRAITESFTGLLGTAATYATNGTTFTVNYLTAPNTPATFPIAIGNYVKSATTNRIARVNRVSKSANTYTVFCDIAPEAIWSGYYIKSFENAASHYKTFVLPKAEISVKNLSDYLSVLSGGVGLYNALVDKDMIDFRYIVDTFTSFDVNGLNNKSNLSQLAKDRQNASAILNAPTIEDFKKSTDPSFTDSEGAFDTAYIATGGNQDKNPTKVYALPSIAAGANYAFYYGPGLIVSDNGKDIIVPAAAYVANNYMDKYTNALPWSIVAGPRRGVVSGTNVKGAEYSFDKNDRDILEPFGINPIVFQRGTGLTILGNKTAQQSIKSALSSAHVREVLIYIQDGMADILKDYVFEFNNVQTRLEIKTLADSFMESVKQDGGVYEFKNVMDQSNNTNEVIDNNMGIIDTYVEPVKGLEIVVHRTTILNTGEIQSGNLG
jgi:hypothetical protein